jgi:hypothetical protein
MKQWITLVAATALFSACTKQDLRESNTSIANTSTSPTVTTQDGAFVSAWEQCGNWVKTTEGNASKFKLSRQTPEVSRAVVNGGVVMTYAKYANAVGSYADFVNPTLLPFYFLPPAERPNTHMNYFSDASTEGNVAVEYAVPLTAETLPLMGSGATLKDMQFQYIALTKKFLESRGLDAQTVKNNYSYKQVMALVGQ